jgi:hypothetical protein
MYHAFMAEKLMAALRQFINAGPPSPPRVRHCRAVRAQSCNKFVRRELEGGGARECARRRRQMAALA